MCGTLQIRDPLALVYEFPETSSLCLFGHFVAIEDETTSLFQTEKKNRLIVRHPPSFAPAIEQRLGQHLAIEGVAHWDHPDRFPRSFEVSSIIPDDLPFDDSTYLAVAEFDGSRWTSLAPSQLRVGDYIELCETPLRVDTSLNLASLCVIRQAL